MILITWNIQWGLGGDGILDIARIIRHAREMGDFDVLSLQEVADNFAELNGGPDGNQFAALAALLPGFTAIEAPALELRDAAGRPKRFGNMILTRLPVIQAFRHILPWDAAATRNMPRGMAEVHVRAASGALRIMTTHLEYSHADLREAQAGAILKIHRAASDRHALPREESDTTYVRMPETRTAILCGDFNFKPDDPLMQKITAPAGDGAERFVDAWAAKRGAAPHPPSACLPEGSFAPPFCCDYIFVTEDLAPEIRRIAYDTVTRASDHQPVLIEIEV